MRRDFVTRDKGHLPTLRGECQTCHGDDVVTVGGLSVNPFSGALVSDPQEAHDEPCPDCPPAHVPEMK